MFHLAKLSVKYETYSSVQYLITLSKRNCKTKYCQSFL